MRRLWHTLAFVILTVVTQIGGVAWLLAVMLSWGRSLRTFLMVFLVIYTGFWIGARYAAPGMGRVAVPCIDNGPTRAKALSPLFCALNRTYVTPELAKRLDALAAYMHAEFPGTRTRVLDAGFPFFKGIPLLPHLSHDDGQKVDLAFWYEGGAWRSPIGYWAFERPSPDEPELCDNTGLTLRWNMEVLQPFMRDLPLDEARMASALNWLANNLPENGKVFIEPHLANRLELPSDKIRFQGCGAARHDDHIHVQL